MNIIRHELDLDRSVSATTGLPSGRLVTCPRELITTFKSWATALN